jgi:hypothetical protein
MSVGLTYVSDVIEVAETFDHLKDTAVKNRKHATELLFCDSRLHSPYRF